MRISLWTRRSRLSFSACSLPFNSQPLSNAHLRDDVTAPTLSRTVPDRISGLDGLSDEVLLMILGFLRTRTLLTCKTVSRRFRSLIENDMLLTYCIELSINGMIDGPSTAGLNISERLDKLRQYSERTCAGQFIRHPEMTLERIGWGDMTHLITPRDPRSPLPDSFAGSVMFEPVGGNVESLVVYAPPSIIESTSARRWTIPLPRDRRILAVDVGQDLVVAIAAAPGDPDIGNMFLLSLNSGGSAAHPLAEEPTWEIDWMQARLSVRIIGLQIFGPYLAWKTPYGGDAFGDHLQVRNWKTGCTLWEIRMNNIPSYTFINTSCLAMVFNSSDDRLFTVQAPCPDTIRIYRFRGEHGHSVGHVATLQLPPGVEGSTIMTSSVPSSPTPPPSAAFWPDPEQRVVVLRIRVPEQSPPTKKVMQILRLNHASTSNQASSNSDALLLIPCTTFHEHAMRVAKAGHPASNLLIPWEDWGSRGSVLIREEDLANSALSHTCKWSQPKFVFPFGSRLTFLSGSSATDRGPRLVTVDVNPLSKLHPLHPGCTRQGTLASVSEKAEAPGLSSALKTTHPRSYFFGPVLPDVQHTVAIAQNASGYTVLTQRQDPGPGQTLGGAHVFTVS